MDFAGEMLDNAKDQRDWCGKVADGDKRVLRPGDYRRSPAYEKVLLLRNAFDVLANGCTPRQVIENQYGGVGKLKQSSASSKPKNVRKRKHREEWEVPTIADSPAMEELIEDLVWTVSLRLNKRGATDKEIVALRKAFEILAEGCVPMFPDEDKKKK